MISDFSIITADGVCVKLNLTPEKGISKYEGNDKSVIKKVINSQYNGVTWFYDSKKILFLEPQVELSGYPTPDMQKVIIIYPMEHILYPAPGNAVIYNADGTVYRRLQTPALISDLAKNARLKPFALFFDGVSWAKDSKGDTITSVRIGYNRDWWESRVLNPETGEFGEVISSGMR